MEWRIVKDYEELSLMAARFVAAQVKNKPNSVLGLATGSTPIGMYRELTRMVERGELSLQQVVTFNLDEYIGLAPDHPQSYHYYMHHHFFSHVDIPAGQIHLPYVEKGAAQEEDCEACEAYDRMIEEHGGIDLQVLGIGRNGHIGFNEPSISLEVGTHIVTLTEETRQANARFFQRIEEVPTHAVTMGVGSIMKAERILLLASGSDKKEVLARLYAEGVRTELPASLLHVHQDVTVIADREAAAWLPVGESLKG